jgi:hypothetical protein
MRHRNLNHEDFSLTAIDDIISRGRMADWLELRDATKTDPALIDKIKKVCAQYIHDPSMQRHHLWNLYAKEHAN